MSEKKYDGSAFADEVEKFSGSKLNKKIELVRLYEEAVNTGKEEIFENSTFTAKYVRGLMRVLKSGINNPEVTNLEGIKKDFTSNMEKLIDQLKEIIISADDDLKQHFENNYFMLSQESLSNLNELLADLEWAKMYLNEQKRQNPN